MSNLENVARDCGATRKSVENYLSILEDLMLASCLKVFTKKAQRDLAAHPKFYYFDAGVFYHLRPKGPLDAADNLQGLALEGLVFQHLQAWKDYSAQSTEMYYWRTRSGVEVDFVIYGESTFVAIEVKNSERVRSEDLRGLKTFGEDYPQAKLIFLYRGKERLKKDKIDVIPVGDYLRNLVPDCSLHEIRM